MLQKKQYHWQHNCALTRKTHEHCFLSACVESLNKPSGLRRFPASIDALKQHKQPSLCNSSSHGKDCTNRRREMSCAATDEERSSWPKKVDLLESASCKTKSETERQRGKTYLLSFLSYYGAFGPLVLRSKLFPMFSALSNLFGAPPRPQLLRQYSLTDCDACLDVSRPSTTLCYAGHRLCLPCALTSLRTEIAEAATRADGCVWCPGCRVERNAAVAAGGREDDADSLSGWILPAVVEKLSTWSQSASEEDRRPVPGAAPLAPLSEKELRRYALRLAARAVAHRGALVAAAAAGHGEAAAAGEAGAAARAVPPAAGDSSAAEAVSLDAWEAAGFRDALATCPHTACGADFLLPEAPGRAAAEAAPVPRHGSACPHCRELLCADCGKAWIIYVTFRVLPEPPAAQPARAGAGAAARARAAPAAAADTSWLAVAAAVATAVADAAGVQDRPADKKLAISHQDSSCAAFDARVEAARLAASRPAPLTHAEWLALPERLAAGGGAGLASGTRAAAAGSPEDSDPAFRRQIEEMAAAGVKYCPHCGAPGTHPYGHQ